jgi:hypothetical protein
MVGTGEVALRSGIRHRGQGQRVVTSVLSDLDLTYIDAID